MSQLRAAAIEQAAPAVAAPSVAKVRILFVDDEPRILSALQRLLRPKGREWEMAFVVGGEAAIEALAAQPWDVLVTDMRMPNVDGAALLSHARDRHPSTIRVVLSGHAERATVLRAVQYAHQYLTKPCDHAVLVGVLERAVYMRSRVGERVRELVAGVDALPSVPQVYAELVERLRNEQSSTEEIAGVVERDAAVSARVLQLANSAFFNSSRPVSSMREAVVRLGTEVLKALVLSESMCRAFDGRVKVPGFSLRALQEHSLAVARAMRQLPLPPAEAGDAFTSAMLHDVGQLVLAVATPERFAEQIAATRTLGLPLQAIEVERGDVGHAEVGAYLLGTWGLPSPVIDAVARHHQAPPASAGELSVASALHLINALATGIGEETIDRAWVERLGIGDKLPAIERDLAGAA